MQDLKLPITRSQVIVLLNAGFLDNIVDRSLLDKVLGNAHGQMGNGEAETVEYTSRRIKQVLLDRNLFFLFRFILFAVTGCLVCSGAS